MAFNDDDDLGIPDDAAGQGLSARNLHGRPRVGPKILPLDDANVFDAFARKCRARLLYEKCAGQRISLCCAWRRRLELSRRRFVFCRFRSDGACQRRATP
jgi:hypothetical protein